MKTLTQRRDEEAAAHKERTKPIWNTAGETRLLFATSCTHEDQTGLPKTCCVPVSHVLISSRQVVSSLAQL